MNNLEYKDALKIISERERLGIMPGLARIKSLLSIMGNPQKELKIIHIAGTNGKGTVAASISNALIDAGYKVGLFTSPYVVDYREQIQLNGEYISEQELSSYIQKYSDYDATEFELLTAIMYKYFYDENVDYAVVECGLGALGDATNTEDKNISVITSVSLDHTNFLGDTLEEIAIQKAGIIKENSICVLYPNESISHIFEAECIKKNTKLISISDCGNFKINNLNTAQAVLNLIDSKLVAKYPTLPARQERIGDIILDGGHNEGAAQALCEIINNEVALISMLKDKDVDAYLSKVAPRCKMIVTTQVKNSRALPSDELADIARKYCSCVISIGNVEDALSYAKKNGLTLVCGSFYLARMIRKDLF